MSIKQVSSHWRWDFIWDLKCKFPKLWSFFNKLNWSQWILKVKIPKPKRKRKKLKIAHAYLHCDFSSWKKRHKPKLKKRQKFVHFFTFFLFWPPAKFQNGFCEKLLKAESVRLVFAIGSYHTVLIASWGAAKEVSVSPRADFINTLLIGALMDRRLLVKSI